MPVATLSPAADADARAGPARATRGRARGAAVEARFPARTLRRAATVTIEGELTVRLDWDGRRVRKATVRSTRPFVAARVLAGRTPDDGGRDRRRACSASVRRRRAPRRPAPSSRDRRGTRHRRRARHARPRWCWKRSRSTSGGCSSTGREAMGQRAATATGRRGAAARSRRRAARRACAANRGRRAGNVAAIRATSRPTLASSLRGTSTASRRRRGSRCPTAEALAAWARDGPHAAGARCCASCSRSRRRLGASDVALMPAPRRDALLATSCRRCAAIRLRARAPPGHGTPVETGALARACRRIRWSRRLARATATRWRRAWWRGSPSSRRCSIAWPVAARMPRRPWVDAFTLREGDGLAAVQTARGLLLHRVRRRRRPRARLPDRRADRMEFSSGRARSCAASTASRRPTSAGSLPQRAARGAGARPLRRLPRRGRPCMRWRSPRACCEIVEEHGAAATARCA